MCSWQHKASMQEKMQRINQRKENYKRSTNNSHKKFICVARKLLYKLCTYRQRELFEKEFEPYQNSRVFYFIILSHVKIRMDASQRENFKRNITSLLQAKVHTYNEEIQRTNNKNFINFRFEEIADIQFALKALTLYLDDQVDEAIEVIYKKQKGFVLKKQQYEVAISLISELEKRLRSYPQGDLFPYFDQKPKKVEVSKEKVATHTGRGKKDEDEEWVQEKMHRQPSRHTVKRQKKKEIVTHQKTYIPKSPMLFLENSFPLNPHFYSVLFSYPDPQTQLFMNPDIHASYPLHTASSILKTCYNPQIPFEDERIMTQMQFKDERDANIAAQFKIKSEKMQSEQSYHLPIKKVEFHNQFNKKHLYPPRETGDSVKKDEDDLDYIISI